MFQIIPSLDLRGGRVVRLQQGDYDRQLNYDIDPLAAVASFGKVGAKWLHIVDLDGAKAGGVAQWEAIGRIVAASSMRVQVGGGVRSTDDVQRLIDLGAARVVVGTRAIEDWPWFEKLASDPRLADRIVLALDAKEGKVATRAWTHTSGREAVEIARQVSDWPLAGILYTDVAKDGMLGGANLEHTRLLAEAGRVPVIASGGVGSIEDIRALLPLPIWGVVIGRSLHDGRVDLTQALQLTATE